MSEWRVELLSDEHDRAAFSCGKSPLDTFLKTQAGQYSRRGVGRTFVATKQADTHVLGYYTLAAANIAFQSLPADMSKRLSRHPTPMILLARLAVDLSTQGQGLGSYLLVDACKRAARIAEEIGVYGIVVHAMDAEAASFYAKFGFIPLIEQPRNLILPLATFLENAT